MVKLISDSGTTFLAPLSTSALMDVFSLPSPLPLPQTLPAWLNLIPPPVLVQPKQHCVSSSPFAMSSPPVSRAPGRIAKRRKTYTRFSEAEHALLIEGVNRFGVRPKRFYHGWTFLTLHVICCSHWLLVPPSIAASIIVLLPTDWEMEGYPRFLLGLGRRPRRCRPQGPMAHPNATPCAGGDWSCWLWRAQSWQL